MPFGLRVPDIAGIFTDTVLGDGGNEAPAMIITELSGERRRILLLGRGLPYRPIAWGGNMRVKTTWYQGNPVATQQVLGPDLDPTVMEGKWKDRFMFGAEVGNGAFTNAITVNDDPQAVRSAEEAVALFHDLRRSGNKLRVVWGPETREGILVFFEAKYDRLQDVAWSAEFEWSSEGESETRAIEEPVGSDDLLGSINSLDDLLGFSPEDVAKQFNAQLLDSVESMREATGSIFGALRAVNTVLGTPQSVVGSISSAANSIRLEATEEIQRLRESPVVGADGAMEVALRASSLMSVEAFRRTAASQVAGVRQLALEIDRQTQQQAVPDPVQVVAVPQATSLYTLSNRFYGTPDFASFLARANGLTSAIAPSGFQLRVPPKPVGDGADSADFACGMR